MDSRCISAEHLQDTGFSYTLSLVNAPPLNATGI